jgi:hypothetical protein
MAANLARAIVWRMIRKYDLRCVVTLLVTVLIALAAAAQSSEPARPHVENTEQLLGILPEVTQLQKLSAHPSPEDRWWILWLHQRINERILFTYLEFDATNAQIDREIAYADELHSYLSDRRDNVVTRANLLGIIIGGGLSATSNGLQLSTNLGKPAAIFGLVGGVASAGFGLMGIHAQNGKTTDFDFDSNMLAEFFDRPTLPDSTYQPLVWTLLNQPTATGPAGETGKEQLLRLWVRVKRVDSLDSKEKIDHLTSQPSQPFKLTIDDLEDRAAMLHDVRARISYLKRDLAAVVASLPAPPASDADSFVEMPNTAP